MNKVLEEIEIAKNLFREKILNMEIKNSLTKDQYLRFLSMQYHLTKGVQNHFFAIAGNSLVAKKRELRKWLINFAQEEEFHFEIAKADLSELGFDPLPMPLDTNLWWLYFNSIIQSNPFIRLGATCVLENIADGSSDLLDKLISKTGFLNTKNLRFLTIHRHGPNLAHGDQIIQILQSSNLSNHEIEDLIAGCKIATIFYLRSIHWVISGIELK